MTVDSFVRAEEAEGALAGQLQLHLGQPDWRGLLVDETFECESVYLKNKNNKKLFHRCMLFGANPLYTFSREWFHLEYFGLESSVVVVKASVN